MTYGEVASWAPGRDRGVHDILDWTGNARQDLSQDTSELCAAVPLGRRQGETWEETFKRECIETAPHWIAGRAEQVRGFSLNVHKRHSTQTLLTSDLAIDAETS